MRSEQLPELGWGPAEWAPEPQRGPPVGLERAGRTPERLVGQPPARSGRQGRLLERRPVPAGRGAHRPGPSAGPEWQRATAQRRPALPALELAPAGGRRRSVARARGRVPAAPELPPAEGRRRWVARVLGRARGQLAGRIAAVGRPAAGPVAHRPAARVLGRARGQLAGRTPGRPAGAPGQVAARIAGAGLPAAGPVARRRVEPGLGPGRWKKEEREPTKRAHAAWSPSAKAASPLRHPCEAAGACTISEKTLRMPATR
jgi:hypothetical protein